MNEHSIRYETFENITNKEQLGLLTNAIIRCITKAFGHEMPEDEVDDAINGTLIVIAKNEEDLVVGFSTLHRKMVGSYNHGELVDYAPEEVRFSLGAGTIDQDYQSLGIYRTLNRYRLGLVVQEKAPVLTTTTQNPRVERGITMVLEELMSQGKLESFSIERRKLAQFYGRRLTSYTLSSEDTPFAELDMDAGDAFSLIFKLKYPESI